jgi:DNA polymerase epsilon subunit 1
MYEFQMSEDFYLMNASQFAQVFNHEKIEGVYELQVPLIMRALINLGCVLSVQSTKIAKEKLRESSFELCDLKSEVKLKSNYLGTEVKLNHVFLFHSTSENGVRQVFGFFSLPGEMLWVFVVDPAQNRDAIPNIKRLYQEKKRAKNDVQAAQTQDSSAAEEIFQYPGNFDVRLSLHADEKAAVLALNAAFTEYQDQKRGPTMVSLQSSHSSRYLQMIGVAALRDFPVTLVPFHKKDNSFPALGWQSYSLGRMMEHFLNLNDFLRDRVTLSRYGDVPIGNVDHDYTIFFADLFLARRLKKSEMILWYSPSEKPDLGGREQDDNKHNLDELVNPEINVSGNYGTVCIEMALWDLALNTIMQSNMFNEFESSLGAVAEPKAQLLDKHLHQTPAKDSKEITILNNFSSVDESRISQPTFTIIRGMVKSWSEEVAKRNRIASSMLEHFYRWITSTASGMYDPALYSLVHDLMKRTFIHLIAEIRNFGSHIVFASFQKIVIATSKTEVSNAISYVNYVLKTVAKNELFKHIDLKPTQVWEHLIWMDAYNYGGIICENSEDGGTGNVDVEAQCGSAVDFHWNMADYLPAACKRRFMKLTAEYIFEILCFKKDRESDAGGNKENDAESQQVAKFGLPSKQLEQLSSFLRKLLSSGLKRKLLSIVKEIQRLELNEDDVEENPYEFPILPGSHLDMKNPALEFVKLISKFFSLDTTVSREFRTLRKDMLTILGIREFSEEANYVNPCEPFSLPQVICDYCNHCQDLDLTREEDILIESEEESNQKSWLCSACHTLYDTVSIEQRLVNIVRKRLLTWQLQDLKCEKCKLVRAEEVRDHCAACSGKLATELDHDEFRRKMKVFENIANYYEMPMLHEVVKWVLESI